MELPRGSVPAIWQLYRNVQLIRFYGGWVGEEGGAKDAAEKAPVLEWDEGSVEGLPPVLGGCLRELTILSGSFVSSLGSGVETEIRKNGTAYLRAIRKHLNDAGVSAWVACRCGLAAMRGRSEELREAFPRRVAGEVFAAIRDFYRLGDRYVPERYYFYEGFRFGMPMAIRLDRGGEPTALHVVMRDLLDGNLSEKRRVQCEWLVDMPIPSASIRPLVEFYRDRLAELLRFIGGRRIDRGVFRGRRLLVNDTRRVLRVCRETDDAGVLTGAATVLVNASFGRVAAPELVTRILSAAPSSELVDRVFRAGSDEAGRSGNADRKLAQEVGHLILGQPSRHPFRTINRAVAFLADTEAVPRIPLFEERPDLLGPAQDRQIGI